MQLLDECARINQRLWDEHATHGSHSSSQPWLHLDSQAFADYRERRRATLPEPYADRLPDRIVLEQAGGKDVLCLASGGGQQSAVLGLLGARVTVLDLSRGQLDLDEKAARHYGYPLRTIQADMRDLSALRDGSFDCVVQGVGLCFVPDVREVYYGVARVLRPGGLYSVVHCNPVSYPVCFDGPGNGWDGIGYRIAEPYRFGPIRRTAEGHENMTDGAITGEHRHSLGDLFNGLIECGLVIRGVWDDASGDLSTPPGTPAHIAAVVPEYYDVLAEKTAVCV